MTTTCRFSLATWEGRRLFECVRFRFGVFCEFSSVAQFSQFFVYVGWFNLLPFDAFQLSHFAWTRQGTRWHRSHGCVSFAPRVAFHPFFPFSACSILLAFAICHLHFIKFSSHLAWCSSRIFLHFILQQFYFIWFSFSVFLSISFCTVQIFIDTFTHVVYEKFEWSCYYCCCCCIFQLMVWKETSPVAICGHLQVDFVSFSQTNLTLIDAKINLKSNFLQRCRIV